MLSVLWFTAEPCRRLITYCTWKGRSVPCDAIFYPIPTDIGFCCAFNHNTLSRMLRGHRLAKIIENIEAKFDKISRATSFAAGTSRKNLTAVDYAPKWGIQNGLTVVVDTLSEWNPASVRQDFLGVQAALKGKNQVRTKSMINKIFKNIIV